MKLRTVTLLLLAACLLSGCTVIQGRVMPYPAWAWSKEAKQERAARKANKIWKDNYNETNGWQKIQ